MGGGRQQLKTNSSSTPEDPVNRAFYTCTRADGRDLIAEWIRGKEAQGARYAVPKNKKELLEVETGKTDYLLGIFHNDHFPYAHEKDNSEKGVPSLEEMTTTAIKVLRNDKDGFFLMVESALIDQGHHAGRARVAINEVIELNKAVNSTMDLLKALKMENETLVIVTSDHSHTLTISGYPNLGADILGIAGRTIEGTPYTTLSYGVVGKKNYHFKAVNGTVVREDPSKVDTTSYDYRQQGAVKDIQNNHGGSDVFVYATGPYSHLLHNMHEQSYLAEVMSYASRIGSHSPIHRAKHHRGKYSSSASLGSLASSIVLLVSLQLVFLIRH